MSSLSETLTLAPYASMSDAEVATAINACDKTEICSRFGSFRTLANLLTETEYHALRSVLDAQAASSTIYADMVATLKLPGDEAGNGGGIDFGADTVRSRLDALHTALTTAFGGDATAATTLITTIKAYAERLTSTARLNGWPEYHAGDIAAARAKLEAAS